MTEKMDIYSNLMVPFSVAAFCRGRRFCAEAVALGGALRSYEAALAARAAAEAALEEAEKRLGRCSGAVQRAVERVEAIAQ